MDRVLVGLSLVGAPGRLLPEGDQCLPDGGTDEGGAATRPGGRYPFQSHGEVIVDFDEELFHILEYILFPVEEGRPSSPHRP